jgi:hypothetical protein
MNDKNEVLENVNSDRRGLLKRIMGAGFAVPVITTFSVGTLMADTITTPSTGASNMTPVPVTTVGSGSPVTPYPAAVPAGATPPPPVQPVGIAKPALVCEGYAGTPFFHAHVSDSSMMAQWLAQRNQPLTLALNSSNPSYPTRLNGEVTFQINAASSTTEASLQYQLLFPSAAVISNACISVNGVVIAMLQQTISRINPSSIQYYTDLASLFEEMAAGRAVVEVYGSVGGSAFGLSGTIEALDQPLRPVVMNS